MINNQVLKRAIKSACKSNVVRGKIGAVAFLDNGTIITHAHNSSFLGSRFCKTIHAEEALLDKLDKISAVSRYRNINILVVRWRPGAKSLANAKPCNECAFQLSKYPFKVWYSNEDGNIEEKV
jgi:cytidine deaminase